MRQFCYCGEGAVHKLYILRIVHEVLTMKTALVCAIFLGDFAADGQEPASAPSRCKTVCIKHSPAPVAEMTVGNGPTVGGVILRVNTAPEPLRMFSPLAPPEYGSARNLLTFTDDPNRNANPNIRKIEPDGIRLLTLRPNW